MHSALVTERMLGSRRETVPLWRECMRTHWPIETSGARGRRRRERATKAVEAAESYREAYVANIELRSRVETLELDLAILELHLAEANRRKAGYLPEGVPDSKRLKPGQLVRVSKKGSHEE